MSEIKYLSRQINLNNLTYYFKSKSISPMNFTGFKAPLHFYGDIYNGNIKLAKAEEDQEQFKLDLNEITRENPKKRSADQIKTIENIKTLYKLTEKIIKLYNDYAKITSEAKCKIKHETGLRILTPLNKCFKDYQ